MPIKELSISTEALRGVCFFFHIPDLNQSPISYKSSFRRPYTATDISHLTLFAFILASGTIGNALVIRSFIQVPDQPGSRFVIGLCVLDLMSSLLVPINNFISKIYAGKHWPLGKIGCFMMNPWVTPLFWASAWMLVAISLERAR